MKTSLIRFRVADFLKQYPPFDGLPESDLFELAGTGKVSFHEVGEFVFRRGRPRKPSIWVIQQGTVELIDESDGTERLIDLLGPGDALGLFEPSGTATYVRSARTRGDVVLYSIDARSFEAQVSRHPRISRYLAAYSSIAEGQPEKHDIFVHGRGRAADFQPPPMDYLAARTLTVSAELPFRDVAIMLSAAGNDTVAVVDEERRPLAVASASTLIGLVLDAGDARVAIGSLTADSVPVTARPAQGWRGYLRVMLRERCDCIAITRDGTRASPLLCLLTSDDVTLLFGANPVLLRQRLLQSSNPAERRILLARMRGLLADALAGPAAVQHVAEVATFLYEALIEAIVRSAGETLAARGCANPGVANCWFMLGRSGRGEAIALTQPEVAVVHADVPAERAAEVGEYFRALAAEVAGGLAAVGLEAPGVPSPGQAPFAMSFGACANMLEGIVADPIDNDLYASRSWLDARRVVGDAAIAEGLNDAVGNAMRRSKAFIPILANDTLENMPPMTFFQGLVIALDGEPKDALDLEATALLPIVDSLRVYVLAAGDLATKNTFERIGVAAIAAPRAGPLFRDVASALRTVSYYHAAAMLNRGSDGALIRPDQLSRSDQRMLKGAFQTIRSLVEQISSGYFWRVR